MGLFQKAVETYDAMASLAGKEQEGKEPLAPIAHLIAKAAIEITIDNKGKFIGAAAVENKICIPCTMQSAGRSSAPAPHGLCDQLGYITPIMREKHDLYMKQLEEWLSFAEDLPKLKAVYTYVQSGTVISDLKGTNLIKRDKDGNLSNVNDLVCWNVVGLGEESGPVWIDEKLQHSFKEYYLAKLNEGNADICMVTGAMEAMTEQHLKGVFSKYGNAKLISANDTSNFTYRGRFTADRQSVTIGYVASQKAHNALKWLAANQGTVIEGKNAARLFLCWNPQGKAEVPSSLLPLLKRLEAPVKPTEYREKLRNVLLGYRDKLPEDGKVVIASFEAATTGRLSVTYYNELRGSDFLARLEEWDSTCCWLNPAGGVSSPSLLNIATFAFGTQRGTEEKAKFEADERMLIQHVQQLLACRINKALFPRDILHALIRKTVTLQNYTKYNRSMLLSITCAAIRKYRLDHFKEDWPMALEPEKKDRSYQFGRLLAVLEKIEYDVLRAGGETRETNAMRLQSVFVQRPMYAYKIILEQLKLAYYPRLSQGSRVYYEKLIGEIMELLSEYEEAECGKALGESYLMGYYLQKNTFYSKKENTEEDMENE